ncbi:hypothetical protein BDL97_18G087000 [Sphagnum fallax]|nr:hypothetical protein BDL97_18G087000 [Sphagnum fallax]
MAKGGEMLTQDTQQDGQACQEVVQEYGSATEHTATIIDGKAIARQVQQEIAVKVSKMKESVGKAPGLAVILVGTRKDSETYVQIKKKACEEVGFDFFGVKLPDNTTQDEILKFVKKFNDNPAVHGTQVQLPLPKGKHAVVIGRSNIVGTPAALLLQQRNATVTVVHSKTPNPAEVTRNADIVIAAVGVPELVRGSWLKPGAVVLDVGINPVEDLSKKKGYRLVGDVCYKEASLVASKITPVPGGVGPMTIAMLPSNTLESAKRAYGLVDT